LERALTVEYQGGLGISLVYGLVAFLAHMAMLLLLPWELGAGIAENFAKRGQGHHC
jgi:hypothetical protein